MAVSAIPSARPKRHLHLANDNDLPTPPAAPAIGLAAVLARLSRRRLEGIASAIIEELDRRDGDPDVEANGDELDFAIPSWEARLDMRNRHHRRGTIMAGNPEDAEDEYDREQTNEDGVGEISRILPRYGLDQSLGPINEAEAHRAWQDQQRGAA